MKWPVIIAGSVLLLTVAAAGHRVVRPAAHTSPAGECGSCHAGDLPENHTPTFIKTGHGERARTHRAECQGCHRNTTNDCKACHQASPPEWHTKPVREPGAGISQRNEHRKAAFEHGSACAECHAPLFQLQCASCHRADESWLQQGKGAR